VVDENRRRGLGKHPLERTKLQYTSEMIWRRSIKKIALFPHYRLGRCRLCPYIVAADHDYQGESHRSCLLPYQYRQAKAQRMRAFAWYPPRPRGQTPHKELELRVSYFLAVAHLLRGFDIGDRDQGVGLAGFSQLDRTRVQRRINTFVDGLPMDGRGDKRLVRLARALHWARAYRDLKRWLEKNGWPMNMALRRLSRLGPSMS